MIHTLLYNVDGIITLRTDTHTHTYFIRDPGENKVRIKVTQAMCQNVTDNQTL